MKRLLFIALPWIFASGRILAGLPEGRCVTHFDGHASFGHDFSGAATSQPFSVTMETSDEGPLLSFDIVTPFEEVTTFHKKRDREMREHFHAETYPQVMGRVTRFPLRKLVAAKDLETVPLPFEFAFMGQTNRMEAVVHDVQSDAGGLHFTADFNFSHKAFGVKPKSMIGLFKVKDGVEVSTRVDLQGVAP